MSFRTRLFVTFLFAGLVPIVVLAFVVRGEMTTRLTNLYEKQVAEQISVIEGDLELKNQAIAVSLTRLKNNVLDDNRMRSALRASREDRRYLLDYAADQMRLSGLQFLQIQNVNGRILSSGHFRNEYDRIELGLPVLLSRQSASSKLPTLIDARSPEGPYKVLARVDSFQVGGASYYLLGGLSIDSTFLGALQRTSMLSVSLQYSDEESADVNDPAVQDDAQDLIVEEVVYPFIDAKRKNLSSARFKVFHDQSELIALRANVNRWFLIVGLISLVLATFVLTLISARMSRPIKELADKTAKLDLDKLDVSFRSDRKDEIGALSNVLSSLTDRLRRSTSRIKDAERRAAMGDLARQVNHDIKNGLTPIRNVFRHLTQLADSNPTEIPQVFEERKETVNSSIDYLQDLAANYARLTPRAERISCDLHALIRQQVKNVRGLGRGNVQTKLQGKAVVKADPLSLRRIVENLLDNALDSTQGKDGKIEISTAQQTDQDNRKMIVLTIGDNGVGMTKEQIGSIFQDFYTTKEKGTGLGLSIVRRLVMDLDGSIRVESEPGKGARFIVALPCF